MRVVWGEVKEEENKIAGVVRIFWGAIRPSLNAIHMREKKYNLSKCVFGYIVYVAHQIPKICK